MAHVLGGVLAMLFWAYLRRNVPDLINKLLICLIAFAVMMMVLAVAARAEDASAIPDRTAIYQAAETRLLMARLRHVEEKVAREERAVRKITKKCRAHFKKTIVIRIYER